MNPLIFKKEEASSCLVPDKGWGDVIGKPYLFEDIAKRILEMTTAAGKVEMLTRGSSLKYLNEVVDTVLVEPLLEPQSEEEAPPSVSDANVSADAFWNEIGASEEFAVGLSKALERTYVMKQRLAERAPLTEATSLQETKALVNSVVLNPLKGADVGE